MSNYETCCDCGSRTGRAGRHDDSLYAGDWGPYCEDCWDDLPEELVERIGRLKALNTRFREALELSEKALDNALRSAGTSVAGFIATRKLMAKAQAEARAAIKAADGEGE